MEKTEKDQTSARIDQKTNKELNKLIGLLLTETGEKWSRNKAIEAACKHLSRDLQEKKKQIKLL